ncbi:MAG: polysaccharide deacetylase family protein [Christensenellales bacterium]|jgi:polysaccharide deacetylase family sporulation protein PdaB
MRVVIIKKRHMVIAAAVLLVALGVALGVAPAVEASARKREIPVYSVERNDKKIALSLDAAWSGEKTHELMEIFDEHDVKTTFFLCGIWVDANPEELLDIVSHGHELGNHGDNHLHMNSLGTQEIIKEVKSVNDKIYDIAQVECKLFRPPYGEYNNLVVSTVRGMDMEVVQWSADSIDWKKDTPDNIVNRVMKRISPGGIILSHNDAEHVLTYMPVLIEKLKAEGYEFVTISELLLDGETYVDNNGVQRKTS